VADISAFQIIIIPTIPDQCGKSFAEFENQINSIPHQSGRMLQDATDFSRFFCSTYNISALQAISGRSFSWKMKQFGNNVPHSKHKTRRTWLPNVRSKRLPLEATGETLKLKVTTRCIEKYQEGMFYLPQGRTATK